MIAVEITRSVNGQKWVVSVYGEVFSQHRALISAANMARKLERVILNAKTRMLLYRESEGSDDGRRDG